MTYHQWRRLASKYCGGSFTRAIRNPPECLHYQEYFLGSAAPWDVDGGNNAWALAVATEEYHSGIMDGTSLFDDDYLGWEEL